MKSIFGREPAVFWSLVAGVILALLQLVHMPTEVNGALNALTMAAAGVLTAAMVATDKLLPALVGLVQAVFALFLSLGTPVPETTQTGILALLAAVASFFVRQQVGARHDASGADRLETAYQNGYERGADDSVPVPAEKTVGHSGTHGLTETMPRVGDIYDQDKDVR